MPSPIIHDLSWPEMAWYCPKSAHLLLIHVSAVHAVGFCVFNTIACNSTVVTQGTHNPNSANSTSLIKAELNFNQLKLTCVRFKHVRNQSPERLGSKGAANLGRLKINTYRSKYTRSGTQGEFRSVPLTAQTSPSAKA